MSQLMKVIRTFEAINDWTGRIISFMPVPIVFIMVYEVIARYVFNAPTSWAYDGGVFLFAIYIAMVGGYALCHRAHVNVDIFYSLWPLRVRAFVDIITFIFILGFCTAIIWKGCDMMVMSIKIGETFSTSTFRLPLYPIKIALVMGTSLVLLQALAKLLRDIVTVITGREPAPGGVV
jgi:TRAP-type mannitol/chloroaromatic compound transport system permease small subunit